MATRKTKARKKRHTKNSTTVERGRRPRVSSKNSNKIREHQKKIQPEPIEVANHMKEEEIRKRLNKIDFDKLGQGVKLPPFKKPEPLKTEGVEQSGLSPLSIGMSDQEYIDAAELAKKKNEADIALSVSNAEREQARQGIVPDGYKLSREKERILWGAVGTISTILSFFLGKC